MKSSQNHQTPVNKRLNSLMIVGFAVLLNLRTHHLKSTLSSETCFPNFSSASEYTAFLFMDVPDATTLTACIT